MGHWALGIGHWALGMGHGALGRKKEDFYIYLQKFFIFACLLIPVILFPQNTNG
jgi:hypothetical protein